MARDRQVVKLAGMQCLTRTEISDWVKTRGLVESPYHGGYRAAYYRQFAVPAKLLVINAFVRNFLELLQSGGEMLVSMEDWSLYQPSEMIAVDAIRQAAGERRPLIEAPGHLIGERDDERVVALFGLSVACGWSSHLYSGQGKTVLYNWEGDLFDFYTEDGLLDQELRKLLVEYGLEETGSRDP